MKAIPAIDLREGACVQLVGGSYANERVRRLDVQQVAEEWSSAGFDSLHVVDLDAACKRGSNRKTIEALLARVGTKVQVGGGVRTLQDVEQLFDLGAARVVLGTRAIADRAFRDSVIARWPNRLVLAADVRERTLLTQGWAGSAQVSFEAYLDELALLPVASVLVTAVHVEGALRGTDVQLYRDCKRRWPALSFTASGGITTTEDLQALQTMGVEAAVLGMALYTQALDARAVARSFAS